MYEHLKNNEKYEPRLFTFDTWHFTLDTRRLPNSYQNNAVSYEQTRISSWISEENLKLAKQELVKQQLFFLRRQSGENFFQICFCSASAPLGSICQYYNSVLKLVELCKNIAEYQLDVSS